jgi:regulator of sigma E protease
LQRATKEKGSAEVAEATNNVAGPLGILAIIFPAGVAGGLTLLVFLIANISLALAIMNVLPIPALDGGRWFTMTIYRLMKRPLTKEREEKIQTAGFLALMALVVLVTVADVGKFTQ